VRIVFVYNIDGHVVFPLSYVTVVRLEVSVLSVVCEYCSGRTMEDIYKYINLLSYCFNPCMLEV